MPQNFTGLILPIAQIPNTISLKVLWPSYEVRETWPRNYHCCFTNNDDFLARLQFCGCRLPNPPIRELLNNTIIPRECLQELIFEHFEAEHFSLSELLLSKAFWIPKKKKKKKFWQSSIDESILPLANPVYRKDGCFVIPATSRDCYTSILFSSTLAECNSVIILQATDKVSFDAVYWQITAIDGSLVILKSPPVIENGVVKNCPGILFYWDTKL